MVFLFNSIWTFLSDLGAAHLKDAHFNFITMHYTIIIGAAIFGSICLYFNSSIDYIDALIMSSGAATQGGLNTVDINRLKTWQQVILYIIPMVTNPITIHTSVVFLRLWWFEKKFQHVVQEARKTRRSISKTFSRSKTNGRKHDLEEQGISGRKIVVMHKTPVNASTVPTPHIILPNENTEKNDDNRRRLSSWNKSSITHDNNEGIPGATRNDTIERQIKFSDHLNVEGDITVIGRLPAPRSKGEHIAILQRQRDAENGETLRIPGPRDADAGVAPHSIYDDVGSMYNRKNSNVSEFHHPRRNLTYPKSSKDFSTYSTINKLEENDCAKKASVGTVKLRKPSLLTVENINNQRTKSIQTIKSILIKEREDTIPYLSWQPTIGRNSAFPDLTEEQRDELGGIEYRSLKTLAVVLVSYFWGFTLFGIICLVPWILKDRVHGGVVEAFGQGRVWWGVFTANSAFTDLGFTLTPDSMVSFQLAIWPLIIMSFLITIGNTAFPIMLRLIIWICARLTPAGSPVEQELRFLLDHPRRCFTLLFPAKATMWLVIILILLSVVDVVISVILDFGNLVVPHIPLRNRILDSFFQAASTRTAGFAIVDISTLHPAIQISFLMMMYISVFPIAISVRRTNVYEEQSLGIYGISTEEEEGAENTHIGTHLRQQLSFDLWYICLGLFIISISEGKRLQSGDPRFTLFTVIFEIVSAYGTIGLSLGYPGINSSFSTEFGVIAKLVIIAMQIRGRHRGLPSELDKAIILPSERLQQKAEEESFRIAQLKRTSSAVDFTPGLRKSSSRGQTNGIFSAVFYPGPPLPRSYRNLRRDSHVPLRRHSVATSSGQEKPICPLQKEYNQPESERKNSQ